MSKKVVYNVTMKVEDAILNDWLHWMRHIHIPEVLACGLFSEARFFLMDEVEEGLGDAYVVQYTLPSIAAYETYLEQFAPALREKTQLQFGSGILAFRTHMHLLQEWKIQD